MAFELSALSPETRKWISESGMQPADALSYLVEVGRKTREHKELGGLFVSGVLPDAPSGKRALSTTAGAERLAPAICANMCVTMAWMNKVIADYFPGLQPTTERLATFLNETKGLCFRVFRDTSESSWGRLLSYSLIKNSDDLAAVDRMIRAVGLLQALHPVTYMGHVMVNTSGLPVPGKDTWQVEVRNGKAVVVWMSDSEMFTQADYSNAFMTSAVNALMQIQSNPGGKRVR
jgi:hypothetical protein